MCTLSATFAFRTATYERTKRYKTRDVVKTYLNVTFEDLFSNAPLIAKVEFGHFLPNAGQYYRTICYLWKALLVEFTSIN